MTLGELMTFCKDYWVSIIIGHDSNCIDPVRIEPQWCDIYLFDASLRNIRKGSLEVAKEKVKNMNLDELIDYCERNGVSIRISYDVYTDSARVRMKTLHYQCQCETSISSLCIDQVSARNEHFQIILSFLKEKIDNALGTNEYPKPLFIIP